MRILWAVLAVALLLLAATAYAKKGEDEEKSRRLPGDVLEPSAMAPLPDGRFLVLSDQAEAPFYLLTLDRKGEVTVDTLTPERAAGKEGKAFLPLNDLEGAAVDGLGGVYLITSHAMTGKGKDKEERQRLLRFDWREERMVAPQAVVGLKEALADRFPFLQQVRKRTGEEGGLNVEGLTVAANGELLLGLRSPLVAGRAVVIPAGRADGIFRGGGFSFSEPWLLELGGQGIRDLAWDAGRRGYWILSGPVGDEKAAFGLWFLADTPGGSPRRVEVAGFSELRRPEAVTPVRHGGGEYLLILSDEKKSRYLLAPAP